MLEESYILKIKEILRKHLVDGDRALIFGSSVENEKFGDVDLGIISDNLDIERAMRNIREDFEESTLPYKFDVININKTNEKFRTQVLNGPKIWII